MMKFSALTRRICILLIVLLAVRVADMPVRADDDHEEVRRAVQIGEFLPLRQILEKAAAIAPGRFLEAELEHEDGREVYEIKILTEAGQVLELYFDARTGELLEQENGDD